MIVFRTFIIPDAIQDPLKSVAYSFVDPTPPKEIDPNDIPQYKQQERQDTLAHTIRNIFRLGMAGLAYKGFEKIMGTVCWSGVMTLKGGAAVLAFVQCVASAPSFLITVGGTFIKNASPELLEAFAKRSFASMTKSTAASIALGIFLLSGAARMIFRSLNQNLSEDNPYGIIDTIFRDKAARPLARYFYPTSTQV